MSFYRLWITMKNVEPYPLMYFQIGYWNREEFKGIHFLEMYMESVALYQKNKYDTR